MVFRRFDPKAIISEYRKTDIADASTYHIAAGIEYVYQKIDVRLEEVPTGAEPMEESAVRHEIRTIFNIQLPF